MSKLPFSKEDIFWAIMLKRKKKSEALNPALNSELN